MVRFDIETPALLLDEAKLDANVARMANVAEKLGVALRPHIKTAKSIDIARKLLARNARGLTVSTLKEADHFVANGITDLFYAVAMTPDKAAHVARLQTRGGDVKCLVDHRDTVRLTGEAAAAVGIVVPLVIEIDVDGHRAGIDPAGGEFIALARAIDGHANLKIAGIMSYGGASYGLRSGDAMRALAARHDRALGDARARLESAGLTCGMTSFGSTPPLLWADGMSAASELRAGVYTFWDVFQAGIGCCELSDIALSVLTTVNGVYPDKNRVTCDAGMLALSADRSTAGHPFDAGFGLVCDANGSPIGDLIVKSVNQEHGLITSRSGAALPFEMLGIGTQLRILPNHCCITAAAFGEYHVIGGNNSITAVWPRVNHWA